MIHVRTVDVRSYLNTLPDRGRYTLLKGVIEVVERKGEFNIEGEKKETRKELLDCSECRKGVWVEIPKGTSIDQYVCEDNPCPTCGIKGTLKRAHRY